MLGDISIPTPSALPLSLQRRASCLGMAWCDGLEEPRLLIAPVPSTLNVKQETTRTPNLEGSILSLRHPRSGTATSYVFLDGFFQELNWFKQSHGSLFLGDYICEDGSLYITTKVDPVFILLPVFEDARMKKGSEKGMFRQLDEILYVDGYPGYQHLKSIAENSMQLVCEVKEIGSSKFLRIDDLKVLAWLRCKVNNLKSALTKLDKNYAIQEEKATLKDSISILSEYLKEPWITSLCSQLQVDMQEEHKRAPDCVDSVFLESPPLPAPFQGKIEKKKQPTASNGRQSKKLKTETDSKNIKDMFSRATRRGTH